MYLLRLDVEGKMKVLMDRFKVLLLVKPQYWLLQVAGMAQLSWEKLYEKETNYIGKL